MPNFRTTALVLFSSTLLPLIAHAQSMCRPIEGKVDAVQKQFVRLVTATDSITVHTRTVLQLPAAQSSDVVVVTDTTLCQSAASALTAVTASDPNPTIWPVWVLKIGTSRYVVFSPDYDQSGEFSDYYIFDTSFNFLVAKTS